MTTCFRRLSWLLALGSLAACASRAEMVVISEIMYHPTGLKPEYFVLLNNSATPFDLANWRVTEGVAFEFPGFSTNHPAANFLRPHERIVLSAESPAATRSAYGIPGMVRVFGPWAGKLSNEGERITVQDKNGARVCTVKYGARGHWSPAADGAGPALVLQDPNAAIDDWHNWSVSPGPDVTPGLAPKRAVSSGPAALRLNEVHFATAEQVDWVEVYNPLPTPVLLECVYLSARRDFADRVPLSGEMAPRGYRSWNVSWRLKKGEITLYLASEGRAVLDCQVFGHPALGDTWQAFPDGAREWFSAKNSTRDAANHPARPTDVVINEVMFDPPGNGERLPLEETSALPLPVRHERGEGRGEGNSRKVDPPLPSPLLPRREEREKIELPVAASSPNSMAVPTGGEGRGEEVRFTEGGEFVELFNRGTNDIDLSGWALSEGVHFTFPPGTKISANGFLVVARDTNWMRAVQGDIPLVGNYAGKIKNHGELLRLVDHVGNLADEVDFKTGGAWPELASGGGSSLELRHPWMNGRLGSAWRDSDESGKAAFKTYAWTNTYLELNPIGAPEDYRELHFHLVGNGHVALRNIALINAGTNFILNGTRLSTNGLSDHGWLCQGTHAASFMTNGELHIVADGHGDNRGNRVEIDVPGIRPNQTYALRFEARWISGTPRLIAQSWDHSLGYSFLLEVPDNLGTPGRVNSRLIPGPAPEVEGLRHHPAVPRSTDAVKISALISSTAPLRAVRLFHRPDSASGAVAWQSQPMEPDRAAGDGTFSAELTGPRTNGQVVQFYVEAVAGNGESTVRPAGGAARPALLVVDDRALPQDLRTARVVVSARDLGAMARGGTAEFGFRFPRLSNHYFNGTFIADEKEIVYGANVRNSGSPRTRSGELRKLKFKLPGDAPYRGRTKFSFDDDAAAGTAYHNRVARYLLYLLGHPANENEFVRTVVNAGPVELREDVEPVDKEFLNRNFAGGSHGELYRIDDEWRFLDNGEGLNEDADWTYKGSDDAGRYRTEWMKRSRETEDDYSRLIALFKTMSRTNWAAGEIEGFLDPQAVLKLAAVRGVIGDWDNFTMLRGRNGYLYRRPGDGLFQFLHWDSDEAFVTGQPLYGERLRRMLEQPDYRRMFYGYVEEVLRLCVQEPLRFKTWLEVQKEASGPGIVQGNYLNFFRVRAPEVREAMGARPPVEGQARLAPHSPAR